ncbi:hypothetical protein GQ53DRAFT_647445 [Thozetella sp. PMI_491]|nr:hypothetical protein GQ53DRAFT_647445 [Thozetella sp. PMI_491]
MFWGCFAGGRKGLFLIWDKELKDKAKSLSKSKGHINSAKYQQFILPKLLDFHKSIPGSTVQQDNTPAHTSESSKAWIKEHFRPEVVINFPPRSPDLNPIENV